MNKNTPNFNPIVENKIRLWLESTVMNVVRTKGGGLFTNVPFDQSTVDKSIPTTFTDFLDQSINMIKEHFSQSLDLDYDDSIITKIMPMFNSDENNLATASTLYQELSEIVFSNDLLTDSETEEESFDDSE